MVAKDGGAEGVACLSNVCCRRICLGAWLSRGYRINAKLGGVTSNQTASRRLDEAAAIQAENSQLKATIVALRDELEQARIDREAGVQQAVALSADEITQLRAAIAGLREALEQKDAAHLDRLQALERAGRDEARQLQETIRLLRDQLEESRARHPA